MATGGITQQISKITKIIDEYFRCSICMELFNNPTFLPCTHVFCLQCIEGLPRTSFRPIKFPCPLCREETIVPQEGTSGLKHGYFFESLLPEMLEISKGQSTISANAMCDKHKEKEIEYYCTKCDVTLCITCNNAEHKLHPSSELNVAADKKRAILKSLVEKVVDRKLQKHEAVTANLKGHLAQAESNERNADGEIDKEAEFLIKKIKAHAQKLHKENRSIRSHEKEIIKAKLDETRYDQVIIKKVKEFAEKIIDRETEDVEFLKIQKSTILQLEEFQNPTTDPTEYVPIKTSLIGKEKANHIFGILKKHQEGPFPKKHQLCPGPLPLSFSNKKMSRKIEITINSHMSTAICIFNGKYLVADGSENKLKTFNWMGALTEQISSGEGYHLGGLSDIAMLPNGNIAVTTVSHVLILTPDFSLVASHSQPCSGIAISHNGNLVITSKEKGVQIMSPGGTILQQIQKASRGRDYLDMPKYVAVTPSNKIVVSDWGHHCVFIFGQNGTLIQRYGREGSGDEELNKPSGLCVDAEGNIIVTDKGNSRLHLLSPEGRFIKYLLTKQDGLDHPCAVTITSDGGVALTEIHSDGTKNVIKTFTLLQAKQ